MKSVRKRISEALPMAILVILLSACSQEESSSIRVIAPPPIAAAEPQLRRFIDASADLLPWSAQYVRGKKRSRFIADEKNAFFQIGEDSIVRVDTLGVPLWRASREDLALSRLSHVVPRSGGRLLVLDTDKQVMARVSSSGRLEQVVSLREVGSIDVVATLREKGLIAVVRDSRLPLVVFADSGRVIARYPFPWRQFESVSPLARQGLLLRDPRSERLFFTFAFADPFFVLSDSGTVELEGRSIVPATFPDLIETLSGATRSTKLGRFIETARCAAILDDIVVILPGHSRRANVNTLLDRYSLRDGRYLNTMRLEQSATCVYAFGSDLLVSGPTGLLKVMHTPKR